MSWRLVLAASLCLMLSGCMGSEKGVGINGLDTITKDDKEEDAWFSSFYGKNHCGVSEGSCAPGEDKGSDSGTGGFWGSAGMPNHDSGAASHSDSGSYY